MAAIRKLKRLKQVNGDRRGTMKAVAEARKGWRSLKAQADAIVSDVADDWGAIDFAKGARTALLELAEVTEDGSSDQIREKVRALQKEIQLASTEASKREPRPRISLYTPKWSVTTLDLTLCELNRNGVRKRADGQP